MTKREGMYALFEGKKALDRTLSGVFYLAGFGAESFRGLFQ